MRRGGVEPPTKFSKRGALTGPPSTFRGGLGVAGKKGVTFFRGGVQFFNKNKLKSEKFNDKKFISKNIFLCHN